MPPWSDRLLHTALLLLALIALLPAGGCALPLAPDPAPQRTPPPALPTATPGLPPADQDGQWHQLAPGVEQRLVRITGETGTLLDELYLLRLDPAHLRFDVGYRPGAPLSLREWSAETGALLVVNAGFFTAEYVATGLTIVDGVASGWSYEFGGMVALRDGQPYIQPLVQQPYDPANSPEAAFQAFPMLLLPGGKSADLSFTNDRPSRRTVIARDRDGLIVLLLASRHHFTLSALATWLADSDLALDVALNLDGGTSSGLILRTPPREIPAFSLLPTVLLVYER